MECRHERVGVHAFHRPGRFPKTKNPSTAFGGEHEDGKSSHHRRRQNQPDATVTATPIATETAVRTSIRRNPGAHALRLGNRRRDYRFSIVHVLDNAIEHSGERSANEPIIIMVNSNNC